MGVVAAPLSSATARSVGHRLSISVGEQSGPSGPAPCVFSWPFGFGIVRLQRAKCKFVFSGPVRPKAAVACGLAMDMM